MKKLFLTYGVFFIALANALAQVPAQQPYPSVPATATNITQAEVFVGNTDPDFGNATALNIPTPGTDVTLANTTINFPALADGVQFVYLRTKDASGKWSLTSYKLFIVGSFGYPTPTTTTNIAQAEVFVGNTDPDFGNATPLNIPTPGTDVTLANTTINFPVLADGVQFVYLRTKDATGNWSLTNYKLFTVGNFGYPTPPAAVSNITQAEVYVGNASPDFGSATPLTIPTPGSDVTLTNTNINFSALSDGVQFVYIRSKDASGKWSLTNYKLFTVGGFGYPLAPAAVPNIVKAEVFAGTDPGIGNAINLPIPNGTDVSTGTVTVPIPVLPNGNQDLFVRSLDASGKWSLTNYQQFTVGIFGYPIVPSAAPAIGNLEYYVDTDPGFGNGTAITVPSNTTDVQLNNIAVALSGTLATGDHIFHIRSKQNPWSIDNAISFNVGGSLPVNWLYVKAQIQNNAALIQWATAQEANSQKYEMEWSTNGNSFSKIGEVAAGGNTTVVSTYHFRHQNMSSGFNYYRLKQVDLNGQFKYSTIVKVWYNPNSQQTIIAPNPVADVLQIIVPQPVFVQSLTILDAKGAVVLQRTFNAEEQVIQVPVSFLACGQYVVRMQYKNDVTSYHFIKK